MPSISLTLYIHRQVFFDSVPSYYFLFLSIGICRMNCVLISLYSSQAIGELSIIDMKSCLSSYFENI